MDRAHFKVTVGGTDVTPKLRPSLISMTIMAASAGVADELQIVLDDSAKRFAWPRIGGQVHAELGWQIGQVARFDGEVTACSWSHDRQGGSLISIAAQSVRFSTKAKQRASRHWDDTTLGTVLRDAAGAAGISIEVDADLASRELEYEAKDNESFLAFGERLAVERGAMFKIAGEKAVFVPKNRGINAAGKALPEIVATIGESGNIIAIRDLVPDRSRPRFRASIGRWYDTGAAKMQVVTVDDDSDIDVDDVLNDVSPDEETARNRAAARIEDRRRVRASGSVVLNGEPLAYPEGRLRVDGVRDGIDGNYSIDSVTHRLDRAGGFVTEIGVAYSSSGAG